MHYDRGDVRQAVIDALEGGAHCLLGRRIRVRSISDEEIGGGASFATHRLRVDLDSGDTVSVVLKDLNPLRQRPDAKQVRRLELDRSRREFWMYQQVLPHLALGTPALYGHRWEPRRGHLWLLLEDVGPHRLTSRPDVASYRAVAAWAARFHAATADSPADRRLLQLDRNHYERVGRRLEECLDRIGKADRPLVERTLARFGDLVELAEGAPHGMVHGELFDQNVLLRRNADSNRIAVIDWETAAIGPRYVDLVSVSAGRWTPGQRAAMRRAYFEALLASRHSPPSHQEWGRFTREVDAVAALQAAGWLAFWAGSDPEHPKRVSRVLSWIRELRLADGSVVD